MSNVSAIKYLKDALLLLKRPFYHNYSSVYNYFFIIDLATDFIFAL